MIFARPDYFDDPFLTADDPDGSPHRPFPALAPEASPTPLNGGDLNSVANFSDPIQPGLRPQRQRPVRPLGVRGRRGAARPRARW